MRRAAVFWRSPASPCRGGAGHGRLGHAPEEEGGDRRQLLRADEADREQGLDDHLGLARRGVDVHDVKLSRAPRASGSSSQSPPPAGFTYKRKLTKPGLYRIVCTLHEEMTMTIRVRQ